MPEVTLMSNTKQNAAAWVKPQLVRLGTIADVRGAVNGTVQCNPAGNNCNT